MATANTILASIQAGRWAHLLPGEYELSRDLQVSRHTVRAALGILVHQGVIQVRKGQRTEITKRTKIAIPAKTRIVRLISAQSIVEYPAFMYGWVQALREMFLKRKISFYTHQHIKSYSSRPEKFLKALVAETPCDLWILHISTQKMQEWFIKSGVPHLLAGSPHLNIRTPFVDIHNVAVARHAIGILLGKGHRKISCIIPDHHRAGDMNVLRTIREVISSTPSSDTTALNLLEYSDEPGNLDRKLSALFRNAQRPSAIITGNATILCGVYSTLGRLGIKIPDDVSLICLKSEPFMRYIHPPVAHYSQNPEQFARKMLHLAAKLLDGEKLSHEDNWLIPDYEAGSSVATHLPSKSISSAENLSES